MGIFSSLFKKSDPPNKSWSDEVLGSTVWSDDEEEWQGEFNGLRFGIAYSHESEPSADVVEFTREVMNDLKWLEDVLQHQKMEAKKTIKQELWTEIDALRIELVSFWRQKEDLVIYATLTGGEQYRAWRMEFLGRDCVGIDFDS